MLTTARTDGSTQLTLTGTLNSAANSFYRIEFFSNASQDATGYGEGQTYLGFANVATDASGNATISTTLSANVAVGSFITATATKSNSTYTTFTDTSEFARNIAAVSSSQATITVDTAADTIDGDTTSLSTLLANKGADGFISLREAITAANNTANGSSADRIIFGIAGTGVHTINPLSALPTITDTVILDATTDDSFAANSNRPAIIVDANNAFSGDGLTLSSTADGSTIRGFVIRDFTGNGITIQAGSDGNTIAGNYIGSLGATGASAGAAEANTVYGIKLLGANNVIGGTTALERNVISGNGSDGINISGASATGNTVMGNYVGTTGTGAAALGNASGVTLANGANNNTIGGTAAGAGNVLSGNSSGNGVTISSASGNVVQGNVIGLNAAGTAGIGNIRGIWVGNAGAQNNIIGGTTAASRNIISANTFAGIAFWYAGTSGNSVLGNYIGTDVTGSVGIGNGGIGVLVTSGAANTTIGGTAVGAGNLISGNGDCAIALGGTSGEGGNVVQGNVIGLNAAGTAAIGNAGGVKIDTSSGNAIGGTASGAGNVIANSATAGISIVNSSATGNALLGNSLRSNGGLGIDLNADGVTANDTGDADTGENNLQNFPVLTSARTDASTQLIVAGTLNSASNSHYRIEFFANTTQDPTGYGEAKTYLGSVNVVTDASGNATIAATLNANVASGSFITATATKSNNTYTTFTDTSELAQNVVATIPPLIATTGTPLAYTENDAATAVDTGLTVTDADSTNLSGATISISANYAIGEDTLAFTNQNGISGSWNATTGVLTLTGSATVANYQAALRSITYVNSSDNPSTTARTVSFVVDDGNGPGNTATRNISVTAVNDAPVVATTGTTLSYTENGAATAVDSGLTVSDVDNVNLGGATVSISANYVSGEDVLAFTSQNGITGSWNATTGVLTLSGSATVANYQTALRSITYVNTSDNPSTATRTVSFVVNDGSANSNIGTRNISVTAVNDAPVVATTGTMLGYTENGAATAVDSGLTVSDVDNVNLSGATISISSNYASGEDVLAFTNQNGITGSWNATTGVLTLTGSATVANYQTALRSITYVNTSDNPSTPTRIVSFVVNDGSANSNSGTRNISVTAVNDPPVVATTGTTLGYTENGAATAVDSGLTVSDVDNVNLSGAAISISANFASGEDVLAFSNQNGITGSWSATTGVLTLTGSATVANYQTALRSITYVNTSDNPSTPTRIVSFVVNDGSANSNSGTRNISVTAVNDPPVVATTGTTLGYTENGAATAVDSGLTVSDVDNVNLSGAAISISANFASGEDVLAFSNQNGITGSWNATTGVLTLSGSATVANYQTALHSITYVNASDNPSTATRTVSFVVNDGSAHSNTGTRDISVTAVNDAPVLSSSGGSAGFTAAGAPATIDPGLALTDVDSPTLASAMVAITGHFVTGQDVLGFVNDAATMGNIVSSYDAATGVLSLSSAGSTATIAQWQSALRAVTYANTLANPDNITRTIDFAANDGSAQSNIASRSVVLTTIYVLPVPTESTTLDTATTNVPPATVDTPAPVPAKSVDVAAVTPTPAHGATTSTSATTTTSSPPPSSPPESEHAARKTVDRSASRSTWVSNLTTEPQTSDLRFVFNIGAPEQPGRSLNAPRPTSEIHDATWDAQTFTLSVPQPLVQTIGKLGAGPHHHTTTDHRVEESEEVATHTQAPRVSVNMSAIELTTSVIGLGAALGLWRAAGLTASLVASRPIIANLDPIALLPDLDDDPKATNDELASDRPDDELERDEDAAGRLLDEMGELRGSLR